MTDKRKPIKDMLLANLETHAPLIDAAIVHHNRVDDEYVVKAYAQGKRYPEADYFTNDKTDAENTAKAMTLPFENKVIADITDAIKLHAPNTLTMKGSEIRKHCQGYTSNNLASAAKRMIAEGTLVQSGNIFGLVLEGRVPEMPDANGMTPEEHGLCVRVRIALTSLLDKQDMISPEDVVRTLARVTIEYADTLPTNSAMFLTLREDASELIETADSLRY